MNICNECPKWQSKRCFQFIWLSHYAHASLHSTPALVEDKKREEKKNASHTWRHCYKKRQERSEHIVEPLWVVAGRKLRCQSLISSTTMETKKTWLQTIVVIIIKGIGWDNKQEARFLRLQSPVTSTRLIMKLRHHTHSHRNLKTAERNNT